MKNLKSILLVSLLCVSSAVSAQTYDFTRPLPVYTDEIGYGIDEPKNLYKSGDKKQSSIFFSLKADDGNYKVTVTLGSKKHSAITMVKAENRRLFVEATKTKKGEFKTFTFVVNKRSPYIDSLRHISLKAREKDYPNWDNRLTLEFVGEKPSVKSLKIEKTSQPINLFLCGNSTVVDQAHEPWASWGQMITRWFDSGVSVCNYAESGLTAGTFLRQNRLEKVLSSMKPGDFVFCEFGHNDQKEHSAGDGAWYNFAHNLKIFIDKVRSRGGIIVFVTPTQRRFWAKDNLHIQETHGEYPDAMRFVAKKNNVPVIELHDMTRTLFETLGYEKSKQTLVHYPAGTFPGQTTAFADNTHFSPYGAYEVAKMIVMGIKGLNLPLAEHLLPEWKDYSPSQPDDINSFTWYYSPLYEIAKPDGN